MINVLVYSIPYPYVCMTVFVCEWAFSLSFSFHADTKYVRILLSKRYVHVSSACPTMNLCSSFFSSYRVCVDVCRNICIYECLFVCINVHISFGQQHIRCSHTPYVYSIDMCLRVYEFFICMCCRLQTYAMLI